MNASATLEYLLLAVERAARNFQSFFPFLYLLEEEKQEVLPPEEPSPATNLDDWSLSTWKTAFSKVNEKIGAYWDAFAACFPRPLPP